MVRRGMYINEMNIVENFELSRIVIDHELVRSISTKRDLADSYVAKLLSNNAIPVEDFAVLCGYKSVHPINAMSPTRQQIILEDPETDYKLIRFEHKLNVCYPTFFGHKIKSIFLNEKAIKFLKSRTL